MRRPSEQFRIPHVKAWNSWRIANKDITPDLSESYLIIWVAAKGTRQWARENLSNFVYGKGDP